MEGEIRLVYNEETGVFEEAKEPYMVVEFATKEDFDLFNEMIEFYQKYHNQEEK